MVQSYPKFSSIAVVREIESPENPGGLERRVALVPDDVGQLVSAGIEVFVEHSAGEGVGFSDAEYVAAGAIMSGAEQIYRERDLIIKFKGPSMASIKEMAKGTTLFCMAHFNSYPARAKLLQDRQINVIAMEEVLESPKDNSDLDIVGRMAMAAALEPFLADNSVGALRVRVIGWSKQLHSSIRRCGNRNPRSLQVIQPSLEFEELDVTGEDALYFYDSRSFCDEKNILGRLKECGTHVFDLAAFENEHGSAAIETYRQSHPPAEFGLRRIQCLHETGQAGARYGMKLLKENKPDLDLAKAKAVVLGYGNVGQGAIHELYDQGIEHVHVLGRSHTGPGRIDYWLQGAEIVVNGAEQSPEMRGKNFLIKNAHLKELMSDGSVVIDLVGGSQSNRSPVEPVIACSFLTEPHFVQDGVTVSALWGWPMMGMMQETAIRYSGQIADVLIGHERMIDGLGVLAPGVSRALVCGPFER